VNLIVEVEDVLHAVPVGFLSPGDEGWLFDRVRSVRASMSLLLSLLHAQAGHGDADRRKSMVTVSWFAPLDPNHAALAEAELWLHTGQKLLADRAGLRWRSASHAPPGRAAAISESVRSGDPVKVLTVCGHGDARYAGVHLGDDRLWDGRGCDLSPIDFLLLVSCSIGRLRHGKQETAVPDVEGFVANLAAQRVQAALACRWPVHGLEAVWFANAVTDKYLNAPVLSSRAAALARARGEFIGRKSGARDVVGLNTLAAFELYGEG
jgi:hypothetical protein